MMRLTTGMLFAAMAAATAQERVFEAFEGDGFGDWAVSGTGFGQAPIPGRVRGLNGELQNYSDSGVVCSAFGGDGSKGRLTSQEFTIKDDYLMFLVGGGKYPGKTSVQLVAGDGDEVLLEAVGGNDLQLRRTVWDLRPFAGRTVRLRVIDDEDKAAWGFIAADHFVLGANPNYKFPPPKHDGRVTEGHLVASEEIPGLTIPEGVKARVVAGHESSGVTSPTALAFGEGGALYVTETHRFRFGVEDDRDHLDWYLDDLASRTVGDRTKLLEKWREKATPERMTSKSEIVRRLSDPDENGVFRKSEVFADGFNDPLDGTLAGVFVYQGTVYLANIPKLYALRDEDGDGKSEVRHVIQDGFGVHYSLAGHDMNGFALGPDGRLYGSIGDRGFNITTPEGRKYEYPDQGAVFRFDPDGSNFEVIHSGLRNPKELAFDEQGNLFSVDNNSDQGDEARIVYVVEGGDSGWRIEHQAMHTFHRQIGLDDRPPSRWMDERMWEKENGAQPAFMLPPVDYLTSGPSGLTYHPGTGFLEEEAGRFLVCDYRGGSAGSGIWSFKVEPSGAGMKLSDERRFNWGAGVTDVEYTWDGRVMVTDFIGGWESHDDGRVYVLEAENPFRAEQAAEVATLVAEGFGQRETAALVGLLSHPDMRVRIRAELELTRREDGAEQLAGVARTGEGLARLHGIWGLGVIARRGGAVPAWKGADGFAPLPERKVRAKVQAVLAELLKEGDAEVRAQAIKALGESGVIGDKLNFGALLQDPSPRVRMFAAIAAGRTQAIGSLSLVWKMVAANEDKDPYLRHAGAYAMQLLSKPEQLAALRVYPDAPVRLAAAIALGRMEHPSVGDFLLDAEPRVVDEAIRMIHDRDIETLRPQIAALLDQRDGVKRSTMMWRRLLHSAYRLGDAGNATRVLAVALDREMDEPVRREALRLLQHWSKPHPVDQSLGRWSPLPARDETVIRGVLQPQVEKLFDVEGKYLEAAIKAAQAAKLDFSPLSDGKLRNIVMNFKVPGGARSRALDLYVARKPQDLGRFLVDLSAAEDDTLAISAIGRLVEAGAPEAVDAVRRALKSDSIRRQQKAWKLAAKIRQPEVAAFFVESLQSLTELDGRSPCGIELLDAAKSRDEPEVKEALAAFDAKLGSSEDPLAKWNVSLLGGDTDRGRKLFETKPETQCMRCHGGGHGGDATAGPDLKGVANRGDRHYLLESLVNPGAKVAPGFGLVVATLKDGTTVGGSLSKEDENEVVIDVAGEKRSIARSDIATISEPVSSMPPMAALLTPTELRDVVAWLSTRREP